MDGETGIVVDDPSGPGRSGRSAAEAPFGHPSSAHRMGEAARRRAVESYDYDDLSLRLAEALWEVEG